jgi:hypothetical protein
MSINLPAMPLSFLIALRRTQWARGTIRLDTEQSCVSDFSRLESNANFSGRWYLFERRSSEVLNFCNPEM